MPINGKRYDWEDITINMLHGTAINITDISYSDEQPITLRYGKGSVPQGYGRGNYSSSASFTIDLEEWERMKAQLGTSIYDHEPFAITISYADSGAGTITDKLPMVKITKVSTSNSQGSENSGQRSIEATVLRPIIYNGKAAKK